MASKFFSLDLFSGIGGNAYALKSIAMPLLYCEIDSDAAKLLERAMAGGFIPTAPVHGDIRTLMQSAVYAAGKAARPLMVAASWPCQGASLLGKRQGMDDPRSGLLRELVAIVLDAQPDVAVLENVFDVVNNGSLDFIKDKLSEAYAIRHTLLKASELGFSHERKRFFAVLQRKGFTLRHEDFAPEPLAALLQAEQEPPRTIATKGPLWAAQMRTFGNSIVPACMHYAALEMLGFPVPQKPGVRPLALVLDPAAYAPPPGVAVSKRLKEEGRVTASITKKLWATPRAADSHGCHTLTNRSAHDLSTMVRFERGTPQEARGWHVNPAFLEYLMGFPPGFADGAPRGDATRQSANTRHPAPSPDVRFTCGDQEFEAHRFILELRAPGLAKALKNSTTVTETGPNTLRRLLYFVYHDTLPPGGVSQKLRELLAVAGEAFGVPGLDDTCRRTGASNGDRRRCGLPSVQTDDANA